MISKAKFYFTLFTFSICSFISLNAQNGSIKGTVSDSTKKAILTQTSITIKENQNGTNPNSTGQFLLENIVPGTYTIEITYTGYRKEVIANVIVTAGNTTDIGEISMIKEAATLTQFKIKAKPRSTATMKDAVQEVKKNDIVVSVIGSEEMNKTQTPDAAKAAARVPGVTLMENRFIMLRGLSQRYNSVQINNINAPSTEVDRRAFSFDLVPASMLDRIMVFKSGAAELAGDFAGGVIKLYTKSNVEKDFITYNIGFGYRLNTTFQSHLNNNIGGSTDYLGFDNGNRALPNSFPSSFSNLSNSVRISYGKELKNNYQLNSTFAPLDFGMGFSFGKNIKFSKKMKLYTVNNIGYSTNYQFANLKRYRYQNDQQEYVRQMFNYSDDNYSIESKLNLLSNWILNINKNSSILFRNMFNQIGENETTVRTGVNPTERLTDEFRNYGFHYTSRSIYFGQLEGTHKFNTNNNKLTYTAGYSRIKRNEPDYRRFRTYRAGGTNDPYTLIDPPSASLFDAARFYSVLNEQTISGNISYDINIATKRDTSKNIVIKTGLYGENKTRDFSARWFGYVYNGNGSMKEEILRQPIDQIFRPENINGTAGFRPAEGTNPNDKYDASNQLMAAYAGITIPTKRMNTSFGIRTEYFSQTLNSATQTSPVKVNLENLNLLPSFNTTYILRNDTISSQLRLAYSRTVNRPEFRELAPFVYYDFMYDVNIVGNPNLKSATIDNVDFRYEYYPTSAETVSVGLFYKNFKNPIENYVQPIGLSQQFTLQNAKKATNFGAEIEIRKSLDNVSQNKFLKCISLVINASLIYSRVDLGDDSTLSQAKTRPLQGQSPYIVNFAVFYSKNINKKKLDVSLAYNIFGKRIAYVGNTIFPTVYEMPRHAIDLTFSRELTKKMVLKFGVSDVLNYKNRLWQDTNGDGKIDYNKDRTDHELLSYQRGQLFTIGLSYKIK
ncbi:MAG: outer membrane beta-barrel protein [Bacteroidota bacterium]